MVFGPVQADRQKAVGNSRSFLVLDLPWPRSCGLIHSSATSPQPHLSLVPDPAQVHAQLSGHRELHVERGIVGIPG